MHRSSPLDLTPLAQRRRVKDLDQQRLVLRYPTQIHPSLALDIPRRAKVLAVLLCGIGLRDGATEGHSEASRATEVADTDADVLVANGGGGGHGDGTGVDGPVEGRPEMHDAIASLQEAGAVDGAHVSQDAVHRRRAGLVQVCDHGRGVIRDRPVFRVTDAVAEDVDGVGSGNGIFDRGCDGGVECRCDGSVRVPVDFRAAGHRMKVLKDLERVVVEGDGGFCPAKVIDGHEGGGAADVGIGHAGGRGVFDEHVARGALVEFLGVEYRCGEVAAGRRWEICREGLVLFDEGIGLTGDVRTGNTVGKTIGCWRSLNSGSHGFFVLVSKTDRKDSVTLWGYSNALVTRKRAEEWIILADVVEHFSNLHDSSHTETVPSEDFFLHISDSSP